MPTKSADDHQSNSRLGALAESLVQSFLLEYCDFCFPCQEKHPADLVCELGSAMYTVQVKSRNRSPEGKYVYATENSRTQSEIYRNYNCSIVAFVFFPDKRIHFMHNNSSQTYFTFNQAAITPAMELDSFQVTLNSLSSVPAMRPLLEETD